MGHHPQAMGATAIGLGLASSLWIYQKLDVNMNPDVESPA